MTSVDTRVTAVAETREVLYRQRCDVCSYPPSMLEAALTKLSRDDYVRRNNEVVIDTRSVIEHLPNAIEAFFLVPDSYGEERNRVINAWRFYWRLFELQGREGPPLLRLDVNSHDRPFTVVRG